MGYGLWVMGYGLAQLFILLFLKFFEMWNTEKPTKKGASLRSASRFARLPASLGFPLRSLTLDSSAEFRPRCTERRTESCRNPPPAAAGQGRFDRGQSSRPHRGSELLARPERGSAWLFFRQAGAERSGNTGEGGTRGKGKGGGSEPNEYEI